MMSLLENIKNHKLASILVLVGAFAGGVATFSGSAKKIAEFVVCLPQHIGLKTEYRGHAILIETNRIYDWKKIGSVERQISTKNNHCARRCAPSAIRPIYNIKIDISEYKEFKVGDRELRNARLKCLSGPCNGWSQVHFVKPTEDSQSVIASFEAWSKPTTWQLIVDVYEYKPVSESSKKTALAVTSNKNFLVSVSSDSSSSIVSGLMEDGETFAFNAGQPDKSGIFNLLSKREGVDILEYIYKVRKPKCE